MVALTLSFSVAQLTIGAQPAAAATIDVTVQARMFTQSGWTSSNGTANPQAGDYFRYGSNTGGTTGVIANPGGSAGTSGSPQFNTNGTSGLVGSGSTAWTAHGFRNQGQVNAQLDLSNQSALGFAPSGVTQVTTGTIFNLGRMVHANRPLQLLTSSWFRGQMQVQFAGVTLNYQWRMNETSNTFGDARDNDILDFTNQISTQTFVSGGITYTLVVVGFSAPGAGNACPATVASAGTAVNTFSTVEDAVTYGCLYASVQQVRPVTIIKQVETPYGAPTSFPSFAFDSASNAAGSVWGNDFALQPTGAGAAGQATLTGRTYTVGENVTLTEGSQTAPWTFKSLTCRDGVGNPIGQVSGQSVTLSGDLSTNVAAAIPITCTYVNTYTPRATLTLRKTIVTTGQPGDLASPFNWTLTAAPVSIAGQSNVSGAGQTGQSNTIPNPAITNQSIIAGTYALSETAVGARTAGYVQDGPWSCFLTATPATSVPVVGGQVALTNGQNVTCQVTNRFQTGTLQITKTVTTSPAGGYTAGASKAFTAGYVCMPGNVSGTVTVNPNAANGVPGAVVSIPNLPAGATCTVTEQSPPSGSTDLANGSWVWNAPVNPVPVVIPANGSVLVNIGNSATQQTGTLQITKAIAAANEDTPLPGYTGGATRTFPVSYDCTIGGQSVRSGTVNVSTGTLASVAGIPATAVCRVVDETLATEAGDFADPSYAWQGYTVAPATATIAANATATLGVTNTFIRNLVGLTIAKTVVGAGYTGTADDFTVAYNCGSISGTVSLAAGASQTVQVPAGVQCTVVESPAPSDALLDPGYVWGPATYAGLTGGTVAVPVGGSATVTVTNPNSIGFGRLALTKAIANLLEAVQTQTPFTIRVSCNAPAQGDATDYTQDFTFTSPNFGSQLTAFLPVLASCTVSEVDPPTGSTSLLDGSYAWAAPPPPQQVTVPNSIDPLPVTVTNDIVRVTAPFAITKTVTNNTTATPTSDFTGTWSCTYGTDAAVTGAWSVGASGGSATLQPGGSSSVEVFVGSICTVTEEMPASPVQPDDPSYVWTTSIPAPVVVGGTGGTAQVGNILNRSTASFSVAKQVTGGEAGVAFENAEFTFDYSCTPLAGPVIAGTLTMLAGGVDGPDVTIPVGSTCIVSEDIDALPAVIDPFTWDGVSYVVTRVPVAPRADGSIQFTMPLDGSAMSVVATNAISPKVVPVTVSKVVDDPGSGFVGTGDIFSITLLCAPAGGPDEANLGAKSVAAGASAVWQVDLGSTCRSTEQLPAAPDNGLRDGSFEWDAPVALPASVVVSDADGDYEIVLTNTVVRLYSTIGLIKTVDLAGFNQSVLVAGQQYSGDWSCTYGTDAVGGEWTAEAGQQAQLTGPFDQVLVTSSCTATEDAPPAPSADPSYRWQAPPTIVPIASVSHDDVNTIGVTNTLARDTGSLTIAKTLSGETGGFVAPADPPFQVGATCSFPGVDGVMQSTVAVAAGAAPVVLIDNVPAGWTCTVNEAPIVPGLDLVDASYAWGAATYTVGAVPFGVDVPIAAGVATPIVVDNRIDRVLGGLRIVKQLQGVPADAIADLPTFTGTYSCQYGATTYTGTWETDALGVAADLTGDTSFPVTSTCTVQEDTSTISPSAGLVDSSWAWGTPTISGPATVVAGGPAEVTVTNTVSRVFSGLQIVKTYTGVDGAFAAGTTVGGTWSCAYGATQFSGAWSLPAAGGTYVVPADVEIPASSVCSVAENTLPGLTDASFAWNDPVFAPATASVTLVPDQVGTVTITNSTRRVTTTFQITKQLDLGPTVAPNAPNNNLVFSGTYECTKDGTTVQGNWGPIATGAITTVAEAILVGSTCSVTSEVRAPLPVALDTSFQWLTERFSAAVVTVSPGGVLPLVTVTNPIVRVLGSFTVAKVVDGDRTGLVPGSLFPFTWSCLAPNGDPFGGAFELEDAGTFGAVDQSVPAGSVCTVTEGTPPPPTHPSYTWSTAMAVENPTLAAAGGSITFTIPVGAIPIVTVTNTLARQVGTYSVSKTSDPPTGSTVAPGDTVEFTVTVEPGDAGFVDDVVVADDLAGLTPFAAVQSATIQPSQGTAQLSGDTLTWDVGRVDAIVGPLTLTYEAIVADDAIGVTIRNAVSAEGEVPPVSCDPCATEQFTPEWALSKSSDPVSGSSVVPGTTITYTLTARNTSDGVVAGAMAEDDASDVLDDATIDVVGDGLSLTGTTLTWAIPTLAAGETATVSYTVVVDDDTWGATLANVVVPDGPGGECDSCETTQFVPAWSLRKTSDPASGSSVPAGSIVTYTLVASNTGGVVVTGAEARDNLADVLSHAQLTGPLSPGLTLSGATLTWAIPDIPVGGSVSVSYRVKVDADAGNVTLTNSVTPLGDGGGCSDCVTENPTTPPGLPPGLPPTGGQIGWAALFAGAGLVLLGAFLLVQRRLRRSRSVTMH
ncbi:DUF5979 domain-containing protein [Microbacterium sp. CFBP9034]|uniref:DUF5979 domain-containing protein n=1 Tax=Microbacterium sp. CFBP9034 TaxID=3096540 RepID=UPI002A69BD79|nr:DUF5979 domain-containing protein [Microbacterium sp. CFBP9034]MDY0908519.1 DUF5979 domain-containing protein [Microbacterium sp. CFBP9034]